MLAKLKSIGPGLLYAGAAVGVSHLVQSTRAGAKYGLIMILVVILANVLKYPFFKAGPLYAAQTGKSLLGAFYAKGKWFMGLFYLVTLGTMFAVQAAVTLITASVVSSIFGLALPLWQISAMILAICLLILIVGHYQWLSNVMKWVIILLTIATLVTLTAAFAKTEFMHSTAWSFDFIGQTDVFFLIALIGWMPAPLDISLWHSEWTLVEQGNRNVNRSFFDFKLGYWGTTFLAVAFVALGGLILKGNGEVLSSSGAVFSGQIIRMYTDTLGSWSFLFVAVAAFTTMFSTTLTVLDAFPRILAKALRLSFSAHNLNAQRNYLMLTIILALGAVFILAFMLDNMKQMVDFATTISFLTTPVLAIMIYSVFIHNKETKQLYTSMDKFLALIGIAFLTLFSAYYLILKF